jgi:hypothetical protein
MWDVIKLSNNFDTTVIRWTSAGRMVLSILIGYANYSFVLYIRRPYFDSRLITAVICIGSHMIFCPFAYVMRQIILANA